MAPGTVPAEDNARRTAHGHHRRNRPPRSLTAGERGGREVLPRVLDAWPQQVRAGLERARRRERARAAAGAT